MKPILFLACAALVGCASEHAMHQPYSGQENREIKSLSADEVKGYLAGAGMGFAKPAELNGYPGPLHTLDSADALGLDGAQRKAIEDLMRAHKAEASRLGAEIVRLERELDELFSRHVATPAAIDAKLQEVSALQARLRASHLKAHVATTALLTPAQVELYKRARGYSAGS